MKHPFPQLIHELFIFVVTLYFSQRIHVLAVLQVQWVPHDRQSFHSWQISFNFAMAQLILEQWIPLGAQSPFLADRNDQIL